MIRLTGNSLASAWAGLHLLLPLVLVLLDLNPAALGFVTLSPPPSTTLMTRSTTTIIANIGKRAVMTSMRSSSSSSSSRRSGDTNDRFGAVRGRFAAGQWECPHQTSAVAVFRQSLPLLSSRERCVATRPAVETGSTWARNVRNSGDGGEQEEKPNIPGSGLRGVDTSKLTGNDKRDAEWFERTAARESRGELAWFEDPVVYIALVGLVPVFIGIWGLLNCYIPGICAPN